MNPLGRRIAAEIAAAGPITVARYMQICLTDPDHGYYTTRAPIGAEGDFTTAPEISQMFGELIGLWLAQVWMDQGAPSAFTLAELGPGRGTLMADILRATARVPGFHDAMALHLCEASPVLRDKQRTALPGVEIQFAETVSALPKDRPLYAVANEFFDALPIRQFERGPNSWSERRVGLEGETLAFGLSPSAEGASVGLRHPNAKPGQIAEICEGGEAVMRDLSETVARMGGAILTFDYGAWDGLGDTLQAVRAHRYAPVLQDPGDADLTAHVSFRWLADAAKPLRSSFAEQGDFLHAIGLLQRSEVLAKANPAQTGELQKAAHRLTSSEEMGSLFKTLALLPVSAPQPPGF